MSATGGFVVDRRGFLRGVGSLAAGGAGLGLLSVLGCNSSNAVPRLPPSVWASLARSLSGRLVLPGDSGYARLARPNNLRYAGTLPGAIALCANARDASTCILWAREHHVAFVARSGGHSYGGYSTTTGLMIDLTAMNGVAFDASTGIATLGGGARNADVHAHFRKLGVAITHGRCDSVGVAGLVLGGGVGFNTRPSGLTCDQLVGTEIVTADGAIQSIDARAANGLFWACRGGGGGNFGINTAFRFQTFDVSPVTVCDLMWEGQEEAVFAALATALEAAPDTLGCKLSATAKPGGGAAPALSVQLLAQFGGTPSELREILAPAYAIAPPARGFIRQAGYWPAQDLISEEGDPEYFHESSRFYDPHIDAAAVGSVFSWLRRFPGVDGSATFKLFEMGGRANAVAPSATAFVHRGSRWLSSCGVVWSASTSASALQRSLAWQSAFYAVIVALAEGGAYQNFIDPTLRDWASAYYGANLARLEAIKKNVDPDRVFTFAEAVP